jgi:hypothetical protein
MRCHQKEPTRRKSSRQCLLRNLAMGPACGSTSTRRNETGETGDARADGEDELIHRILTAPVVCDWMIFHKFEVIVEHSLELHGEASWGELLALTAISRLRRRTGEAT